MNRPFASKSSDHSARAWVVDVNMGYGHSRAAFALRDLSGGTVLSANDYAGIPRADKRMWNESREFYEAVSRLKPIPVIGNVIFDAFDRWQQIEPFYPRRDLSKPNLQVTQIYRLIKKGLGKHLIERLAEDPKPLVTTFFIPAFCADYYDYPGEIYCVTTDADISRSWVPLNPHQSRIKYFASNGRVAERLKLYGVRDENIFLTGFPLPKALIGGTNATVLKDLLSERLCHLDPEGIFTTSHERAMRSELGAARCTMKDASYPLTLTYSVGGAGAQKQIGVSILESLKPLILQGKLRFNLVAGVRKDVVAYYKEAATRLGLKKQLGEGLCIPEFASREEYFSGFEELLKTTDILWTKPSELSFYTGLGIALVMAPPIGSQEAFNQTWLQYVGGGVSQHDPRYTREWLMDWIHSGGMARMAWNGFLQAPTHGTYRIEDIVLGRSSDLRKLPLIV